MPVNLDSLLSTLRDMKDSYERAIRNGSYTNLIRSKTLINLLHSFVIQELRERVQSDWIVTDKTVYGYPKMKEQDIIVQPPQNGAANVSVGPIMAINVRSQLSSIGKNYDTLFERIFAEALNLHNRFPHMVLGYLYLIPKLGYDPDEAKRKRVVLSERYNLEKYILSFSSIAGRESPTEVPWKYERICLLVVDFGSQPPQIIDDMRLLANEQLVSQKFAQLYTFKELSIVNFFDELYRIMMARYYLLGFK